jgi:hypothetical protein
MIGFTETWFGAGQREIGPPSRGIGQQSEDRGEATVHDAAAQ